MLYMCHLYDKFHHGHTLYHLGQNAIHMLHRLSNKNPRGKHGKPLLELLVGEYSRL